MLNNKKLKVGELVLIDNRLAINQFEALNSNIRTKIFSYIESHNLYINNSQGHLFIDCNNFEVSKIKSLCQDVGLMLKSIQNNTNYSNIKIYKISAFKDIEEICKQFADSLLVNKESNFEIFQRYECYNVYIDELYRSVDFLNNIKINAEYFKGKIGNIKSFLPLNQPLYSLVCFGIVPSFLSNNLFLRPPTRAQNLFINIFSTLKINSFFSNIFLKIGNRNDFIKENKNDTNAIIFTGNPNNGNLVRKSYSENVLFIMNGAGHNPIIISQDANISKSIESVLRVCLQNQGQDCAAPNAILVHSSLLVEFKRNLLLELKKIEHLIGGYDNKKNIIGPNSDVLHSLKVAKMFYQLKDYCIYGGNVNSTNGIIYPTVFEIPLNKLIALKEFYAPVILIQPYSEESELDKYFLNSSYKNNAMYLTIFGNISNIFLEKLENLGLHNKHSLLFNTDLHLTEKGYNEYGGSGLDASCIYYKGQRICGATLPQREIFKYLIEPNIDKITEGG